jgi:hypothetical protein
MASGGDRRSEKARADQAARRPSLIGEISARRRQLDQAYYSDLCEMRRTYGSDAVDKALSTLQQRDAVTAAPKIKSERGPGFFEPTRSGGWLMNETAQGALNGIAHMAVIEMVTADMDQHAGDTLEKLCALLDRQQRGRTRYGLQLRVGQADHAAVGNFVPSSGHTM